jgi:hypothetical protein
VFWMDVDIPAGAAGPAPQDLASQEGSASAAAAVQVVPCPSSGPSTTPTAQPIAPAPDVAPTFRTKIATGSPKVP